MRFLPAGAHALLVELDDLDAVRALEAEVARHRAGGWSPTLLDVVPGARTLLLDGVADVAATAGEIAGWDPRPVAADSGEEIEITCVYDGPDLPAVAAQWGVPVPEAIAIHARTAYTVAFCGFAPGFAYLAGLGPERAVARRDSPRTTIPPGSVALAGAYTGIYPRASPGGWQLIGRTDAELWDTERDPPALLEPGRRVRFRDAAR